MTRDELHRLVHSRFEDDRHRAAIELQEATCEASDDERRTWWPKVCLALPEATRVVPYTGRPISEEEVWAWRGVDNDKFRWTWTSSKWEAKLDDPDEDQDHGTEDVDGDLGPRPPPTTPAPKRTGRGTHVREPGSQRPRKPAEPSV